MDKGMDLIADFYTDLQRQGPGGDEQTLQALNCIEFPDNPQIADIGCGTGAQTAVLARETGAEIVAVDFLKDFLKSLRLRFHNAGLKVKTVCADMGKLPFYNHEFDLIWSEGAVYNIGFDCGTRYWNRFLKQDGYLAVTEISWLTATRPAELEDYWRAAYAGIDTIENKIYQLENNGYEVIAHFTLPEHCWIENYYKPMQEQFGAFLQRQDYSDEALAFIQECKKEIAFYEKYHDYYGYEFYIAKKVSECVSRIESMFEFMHVTKVEPHIY